VGALGGSKRSSRFSSTPDRTNQKAQDRVRHQKDKPLDRKKGADQKVQGGRTARNPMKYKRKVKYKKKGRRQQRGHDGNSHIPRTETLSEVRPTSRAGRKKQAKNRARYKAPEKKGREQGRPARRQTLKLARLIPSSRLLRWWVRKNT